MFTSPLTSSEDVFARSAMDRDEPSAPIVIERALAAKLAGIVTASPELIVTSSVVRGTRPQSHVETSDQLVFPVEAQAPAVTSNALLVVPARPDDDADSV